MYFLDTNLYIRAFTDELFGEGFRAFHATALPRLVLSAVVAHELLVGAQTVKDERRLRRWLLDPFAARRRILTPALATWEAAAAVDRRLRQPRRYGGSLALRSFFHDILIAVTCRELGAVLVTDNGRDFALIRQVLDFRFVAPWPDPSVG